MSEQRFIQEVLHASIPVLANFGAPWCGPCRMIEPLLRRFQAEWDQPFKLIEFNADENLILTNQYRIRSLPTLLFFSQGKLVYRLDGIYQRDQLWAELQNCMQLIAQSETLREDLSVQASSVQMSRRSEAAQPSC